MGHIDTDADGLSDLVEGNLGTDPFDKDTDNDGIADGAERQLGLSPTNRDTDGDGYNDGNEIAQRSDPHRADPPHPLGVRDGDHVPTPEDPDGDGLDELQELALGTYPNNPDSDNDGISDGIESLRGTNPNRMSDGPADKTIDLDDIAAEMRQQRGGRAPGETITGEAGRNAFLDAAKAQLGDRYRFGAETKLDDPNPDAFDSSELVEWAAAQAGVTLPDGSWRQYQHLHGSGNAVSVEDALRTPGALVFGFSSDPLASSGRPARSYVAISLGNGRVLDVSERAGEVKEMDAGKLFTHAAVIPEISGDLDSDGDGYRDDIEREYDLDPFDASKNLDPIPAPAAPATTTSDASEATEATGLGGSAEPVVAVAASDGQDAVAPPALPEEPAIADGVDAVTSDDATVYDDTAVAYDDTGTVGYDDTAVGYDDTTVGYDDTAVAYDETTVAYDDTVYDDASSFADIG